MSKGSAIFAGLGFVLLFSGCGGGGGSVNGPVNTPPSILTQPADVTAVVGQTPTVSVAATGTPSPNYQWQKNGVAIAGATQPTYTIPAVTLADSGAKFTVVVSNSVGSVTSNAATLTVNPAPVPPSITQQPSNSTVTAGQTATFAGNASGTPTPAIQWAKNGVAIAGATSLSYTTPPTVLADNGSKFTFTATNSAGNATSAEAVLTVNPIANPVPTITSIVPNSLPAGGGAFTLNVAGANFITTSVVDWNGSPRQTVFVSSTGLTASITAADIATAGSFPVTVVNPSPGGGTSNASPFTVTVAQSPTISFAVTTATVPFGGSQDFQLNATGSPKPTVTCPVSIGSTSVSIDLTKVTFTVPNVQPASNQVLLNCTATNSAGTATTSMPVTISLVGQILGATSRRFFCGFAPCFDSTVVNLTGAFLNTTFFSMCAPFNLQQVDTTHIGEIFGFGSASKLQFCDSWVNEPAPGGGDSNHITFGYIGSQPSSVLSPTDNIQYDQNSGDVYEIKLADGSLDTSFNVGTGFIGIAFDNQTGFTLVNTGASVRFYKDSNVIQGAVGTDQLNNAIASSVAEQNGFGCLALPQVNQVAIFNVTTSAIPTVLLISAVNEPWNVQMSVINGQLACIVQTIQPVPGIAVYAVPSGQLLGIVNAVGAASATTTFGAQSDNWQLAVVSGPDIVFPIAGPGHKVAGALFRKDNTKSVLSLFLFDLTTMSQIGNGFDLSGDPVRIGADNTNHAIVVASADFAAKLTRFSSVDLGGNVTPLAPTVNFLVTGFPYPYVSGSDKNFAHPF